MADRHMYAVETRGICKYFGKLKANDHIDLKVKKQTIHAIIGENGAGKSTLMNMLSDIYKPDSGEILLDGAPVEFKNPLDAVRHGIGMVYQEFMLAKELSVLENIIVGFEVKKGPFMNKRACRKRVEEMCAKYNLSLPLDKPVHELPVAVMQQVEIAKVLFRGAEIIIMDEPTSTLTPQGIRGLFKALRELKAAGKTIILITHKLDEIFAISDEITVMRDGKLIGTFLSSESNQQKLANLMVGREVILQAQKKPFRPGRVLLKIDRLRVKDNDGVERVKNVGLQLREGEILGIAGVAGSGQQFLTESLFGLRRAEKGSVIEFMGRDVTRATPAQLRKMGVGYIPQDRIAEGCNVEGSIWESAIMGYHISHGFTPAWRMDRKAANDFTLRVINGFNVKCQTIEDSVDSLSGGNIQKLIVGRELSQNYKCLIVEDPTRGIDVGAIEYIWQQLIEFASEGVAILLVSHELNEVMQLSDRLKVMYNGELFDAGSHGELTEEQMGLLLAGVKK